MIASTLLFTFFASVTAAHPTSSNLEARAGGPAIIPIPSTCTVTSPYPTDESSSQTYQPGPSTDNAVMYMAYYGTYLWNITERQTSCLEQCNGLGYAYGNSDGCKSAFWAQNLTVPAGYYNGPGGALSIGCLLFNRSLTPEDFVPAPEGRATTPFARNLRC